MTDEKEKYFLVTLDWPQTYKESFIVPAESEHDAKRKVLKRWEDNPHAAPARVKVLHQSTMFEE